MASTDMVWSNESRWKTVPARSLVEMSMMQIRRPSHGMAVSWDPRMRDAYGRFTRACGIPCPS